MSRAIRSVTDSAGAAIYRVPMTMEQPAPRPVPESDIQPRELIVTLFGLYARERQNWLSVAAVVKLMSEVGVDGPAVRSSISRLKRRGVLESHKRGGTAGYSLSASALDVLAAGDIRIFKRSRATVEDGWLLVVFSVPESERDKRHALRTTLTKLGFGTVTPGVWVAPGNLTREARERISRLDLASYVDLFTADYHAFGDLRSKIRGWWDLDELAALYEDFLRRYRPIRGQVGSLSPRKALQAYVPMLTRWRRLPYLDPGLPLALLPRGWKGATAEDLFDELNNALSGPAAGYAQRIIG